MSQLKSAFYQQRSNNVLYEEAVMLQQKLTILESEVSLLRLELSAKDQTIKNLEKKQHIDPLTGAFNKLVFEEELPKIQAAIASGKLSNFSLVFLDINLFHSLQEERNHLWGDEALKILAATISATIRDSDWLIRYGGDEFVLLLPNTDAQLAQEIARRIDETLGRQDITVPEYRGNISIMYGIASTPETPFDELLATADKRLKQKKVNRGIHR